MSADLRLGDCVEVMAAMPDESVDAIVCDPPAGINFMSREWDGDKGGRGEWVEWFTEVASECLRVLKPGGHALVWSLPRTSHWTAWALEDAGFVIRDKIAHIFGSGFPKYQNISAFIDRLQGVERKKGKPKPGSYPTKTGTWSMAGDAANETAGERHTVHITEPVTEAAKQWEGWANYLKPAREDWILCQKPLEGTLAENVLKWGVGGLNIDANRVYRASDDTSGWAESGTDYDAAKGFHGEDTFAMRPRTAEEVQKALSKGRYPAHLLLSHHPGCELVGAKRVKGNRTDTRPDGDGGREDKSQWRFRPTAATKRGFSDAAGTETVDDWRCVNGCPVPLMDAQSGESSSTGGAGDASGLVAGQVYGQYDGDNKGESAGGYGDKGGASRYFTTFAPDPFFYQAKPSKAEREAGLSKRQAEAVNDGRDTSIDNPYQRGDTERLNTHVTVKAVDLMRWLVRLVTPPNGIVLDCFMGSGTTGMAALAEGFDFIGIEREADYMKIARARIDHAAREVGGGDTLDLFRAAPAVTLT